MMYKKTIALLLLAGVSCVMVPDDVEASWFKKKKPGQIRATKRTMTKSKAFKRTIANKVDSVGGSCTERAAQQNLNNLYVCVKSKLSQFVTGSNKAWNKAAIYAWKSGKVMTGSINVTTANMTKYQQWKNIYDDYVKLQEQKRNMIESFEQSTPSTTQELSNFQSQFMAVNRQISNIAADYDKYEEKDALDPTTKMPQILTQDEDNPKKYTPTIATRWANFAARWGYKNPGRFPTRPNPLSPEIVQQKKKSGVKIVSYNFYAALRKLLDDNPNMHMAIVNYYLVENPANFDTMTEEELRFSNMDKEFMVSQICSEDTPRGVILQIVGAASPPTSHRLIEACDDFSSFQLDIGDGSGSNSATSSSSYSTGVV